MKFAVGDRVTIIKGEGRRSSMETLLEGQQGTVAAGYDGGYSPIYTVALDIHSGVFTHPVGFPESMLAGEKDV